MGVFTENRTKELVEKIICNSKDYNDFSNINHIIKKNIGVFSYIPSIIPVKKDSQPIISSYYGRRKDPFTKKESFHKGVDFSCKYASLVYSTAKGAVVFSGVKNGYGNCIIIEHKYGFRTVYAHLTKVIVNENIVVSKGQPIGFVGASGRATGDHLHYEIIKNGRSINPTPSYH